MTTAYFTGMNMNILLLDDSTFNADLIHRTLRRAGFTFACTRADTEAAMRAALSQEIPDFILCNDLIADIDCLTAIDIAQANCPDVPFVIVSAGMGEEGAAECIRRGAQDYVLLGNLSRLPAVMERSVERAQQNRIRREQAERSARLARIIDQAGVSIISTDLDAVVLSWNRAASEVYGYTESEAVGRRLRDVHMGHMSESEYAEVLARIRSGKRYSVENANRAKDGRLLRMLSTHSPLFDAEGRHIGHACIARHGTPLESHTSIGYALEPMTEADRHPVYRKPNPV
jgi:PAS domain S-box-containing protein